MLLPEVHVFCWNTLAGSLIKMSSIVVNLNKTSHILG